MAETMSADRRESPEWAEYERLREERDTAIVDLARRGKPTIDAGWHAFQDKTAALDALFLRLLERREPITLRENTLEQLRQIAQIPTAGPIVTVRLTPRTRRR